MYRLGYPTWVLDTGILTLPNTGSQCVIQGRVARLHRRRRRRLDYVTAVVHQGTVTRWILWLEPYFTCPEVGP